MKYSTKILYYLSFLAIPFVSVSQVLFIPGYIVDKNGTKIQAEIKNAGWVFSPQSFQYKLKNSDKIETANSTNINEIEIPNRMKYTLVKTQVSLDPDRTNQMDSESRINTQVNEIFLKCLIEGKYSLYQYKTAENTRYYIMVNNTIELLNFKQYIGKNNSVQSNEVFKSQLNDIISCQKVKLRIKDLTYTIDDLRKFIVDVNGCYKESYTTYKELKEPVLFSIIPGFGLDFIAPVVLNQKNTLIKSRPSIEAEALLPLNKYKFSLNLEVTGISFTSPAISSSAQSAFLQYKTIESSLGIRYHSYFTKDFKWFAQAAIAFDFPSKNDFISDLYGTYSDTYLNSAESLSGGFSWKGIILHTKFYSPRRLNGNNIPAYFINQGGIKYQKISTFIGYNIKLHRKK